MANGSRLLVVAFAGPAFFLIGAVLATAWAIAIGTPPPDVEQVASRQVLAIMVGALGALALLAWRLQRDPAMSGLWRWHRSDAPALIVAVFLGCGLMLAYVAFFSPLHVSLQSRFGDYVPARETTAALGRNLPLFFIANVVLAPFAEEVVYRGYLFDGLRRSQGTGPAALLSCTAFGLLHWMGGIWYMLLTGVVAGGAFTALYAWRRNLAVPFTAHLALNLAEFAWTAIQLAR